MNAKETEVVKKAVERLEKWIAADTEIVMNGLAAKERDGKQVGTAEKVRSHALDRRDECFGVARELRALVEDAK